MSQWERELETLLATLGVRLDGVDTAPIPMVPALSEPTEASLHEQESTLTDMEGEDPYSFVTHEMEATLSEVARLAEAGQLDIDLRADIVHVLQALLRPAATCYPEPEEWQLTSSAAVLHFCRLVMRLTRQMEQPD